MGKLLSILGVLFLCSTCAAIAQVKERPVPPVAAWAACGPGPVDVTTTSLGTYVHVTWSPVPGARWYELSRLERWPSIDGSFTTGGVVSPPLFTGFSEAGSSKLGFWDAVPDAGHTYSYRVSAIQARQCYGTTSTQYTDPLSPLRPAYIEPATKRTSLTTAELVWFAVPGAVKYRVSGVGLPTPWIEFNTGSYEPGILPSVSAAPPLQYSQGGFTYSISNVPATSTDYSVTAVYPWDITAYTTIPLPAINCHITDFSPHSGPAGTVVTITGDHLESSRADSITQSIRYTNKNGVVLTGSSVQSSAPNLVTTIIPDLSAAPFNYQLPIEMFPQVLRTKWGDCAWPTINVPLTQVAIPPVTVPCLDGQKLADAAGILARADLLLGAVKAGSTAPTAIVNYQDTQCGSKVPPKTVVNLKTQVAVGPSGIKQLTVTNDFTNGDQVYLWLYDYQTGQYNAQNNGKMLDADENTTITLPDGHFVILMAVDPLNPNCGGKNYPADTGNCVVWQDTFWGSASGSSITNCSISTSVCN